MQRIHKILAICLLVTALVFGVLKILGGVGIGAKAKEDAKVSSRDAMTRHEKGEKVSDLSTRKLRQRARKLSSAEATEFLKTTIIPEIHFENITLEDVLKIVNREIAKQTPDDHPRPRILLHPAYYKRPEPISIDNEMIDLDPPPRIDELRLRNVPASVLLKYICAKTKNIYWFYKGDIYVSPILNDGGIGYSFYLSEKLSRLKLEDIDASQLVSKVDEIIEDHDYFGPKIGINIQTTEKARAALLKGEVKLPRINLDLENVTLSEAMLKISEHTGGALMPKSQGLVFNPFNEEPFDEDPFATVSSPSFPIDLDENIFKPISDTDPFPTDPFE